MGAGCISVHHSPAIRDQNALIIFLLGVDLLNEQQRSCHSVSSWMTAVECRMVPSPGD
jgi:hypothetical protein